LEELEQLCGNVWAIEYDFELKRATIFFKKPIIFRNFMRKEIRIGCGFESYSKLVKRFFRE
jgi:hypothetical protein